jgi:hypothetical protein
MAFVVAESQAAIATANIFEQLGRALPISATLDVVVPPLFIRKGVM